MEGSVLVIGGGIAGIQTSLDLTELGFKVYLVERTPSIGGRMAQLDKTFPTNDCSLCILAPKMVEVFRNPNIELMTYHEVIKVAGESGDFKVTVLKKPRYIDESKCKGCGDCAAKCPKIEVPNLFDMNLGKRKSIYIPFPQAVPPIYVIDPELCLKLTKDVCGVCSKVCKAEAINYDQKSEELELNVGAIVVATGFDMFGEELSSRWGYEYQNVVNALEYERILCASGPFGGHVLRPSDEKEPKKIAFIQCAGSRDYQEGVPYCSSVCCMYTAKEAIITKEHSEESECFVFKHEIRAFGKNFYEFTKRAEEEYNVNYFQSKIYKIKEEKESNDLIIHYEDLEEGGFKDFRANMVILATPLVPSKGSRKLSAILDINIDNYGFYDEKYNFKKSLTSRDGIFITGFCQGPKDIPETVADASGVASDVATLLSPKKFTQIKEKEFEIAEKVVKVSEIPKIGVLICHCGINIGKYINVPSVVEYISQLPNVVHCEDNLYSCSSDSQERIKELISDKNLNRFIIASCTPRTHESLFQETCQEAGLNKYLFEMVNIRDQCSWVHMNEKELATEKAKDLIRMAVAKSKLLKPQKEDILKISPNALVIGGGISGMTAGLAIAKKGFKVYLIEKEDNLGGNLKHLNSLFPKKDNAQEFITEIIEEVRNQENIQVFTNSELEEVKGYIGNYEVKILKNHIDEVEIKVGTLIIATGAVELKPKQINGYDLKNETKIITQLELEKKIARKDVDWIINSKRISMILCAGSRQDEGITYCSNICCCVALKNLRVLKEINPDIEVIVLYRDLQMAKKEFEDYYRERREDAVFLRYSLNNPPSIQKKSETKGDFVISVFDTNLQDFIEFETDQIILSTPMIPPNNLQKLAKMVKVPLDQSGFFLEAHVKLRPLDFATDGIFLCGCAQWPKNIKDSISQAKGAAGRAARFLSAKEIQTSGLISEVVEEKCIGCGKCEETCPYNAIDLVEVVRDYEITSLIIKKSSVNAALCKGCGTCAATCPVGAISVKHYDFNQINVMIDSYLLEKSY